MIEKYGSAKWSGGLKDGRGQVSTETMVLHDQPYGFAMRFEGQKGTNPEELIGAAHASCFAMALSGQLEKRDMKVDAIEAKSTVTLDPGGPTITKAHLDVTIRVTGGSKEAAMEAARAAKDGCPVSKLLKADVTMDAKVV